MRGGKEHAQQLQSTVSDGEQRASGSAPATAVAGPSTVPISQGSSGGSNSQPSSSNEQSTIPTSSSPEPNQFHRDALVSAWKSSPVRFFGLFGQDWDRDRSIKTHTSRKTGPRPQKTAKSVFAVFLRSLDRSEPVFVLETVATNLYI